MRHWDELARYERDGFEIIIDKTWEDISPRDLFDDAVTDIDEICRKIDSYDLDWFMLRARAMLDGHELGSHIVGGFLYEDAREVLRDGMADDLAYQAIEEAKEEARRLQGSLRKVIDTLDEEAYNTNSMNYFGA
jgi:hypothetical protein